MTFQKSPFRGRRSVPGGGGNRRMQRLLLLALPALCLGSPAAWAESRTAESVWSQNDAQQRAVQQIPLADRGGITNTECQQIEIGMGSLPRYRCTVFFTPAPATAPAPAARPGATSSPAKP
jgi:hypothetical protein